MNPVVVHVIRPYATEQDYLAAEAWSIDSRSMLLIDAEPLPPDTAVLFDIALEDGQKPIRAEGRVVSRVAPQDGRPGGMKVRFKRFGAATKAFIERAVKAKSGTAQELPSRPEGERPSAPQAEAPSAPEAEAPSAPEVERISMPEVRASMTDLEAVVLPVAREPAHASGLRQRVPGPVAAPANREELLARLRQRRQTG
ncbi:MAG TPA: hypothetical protein VHB79_18285 [Polyangiaceae bacterium]|nr:hypothetical protein [Polyangiaceae bacterium]